MAITPKTWANTAENLGDTGVGGDLVDGDQTFTARAHPKAGRRCRIGSTDQYYFKWIGQRSRQGLQLR